MKEEGTYVLKETINSGHHKRSGGILLIFHPSEILRFIPRAHGHLFVLVNKNIRDFWARLTVGWLGKMFLLQVCRHHRGTNEDEIKVMGVRGHHRTPGLRGFPWEHSGRGNHRSPGLRGFPWDTGKMSYFSRNSHIIKKYSLCKIGFIIIALYTTHGYRWMTILKMRLQNQFSSTWSCTLWSGGRGLMGKGRSCGEQHIQGSMLPERTRVLLSEAQGCKDAKSCDSPPECVPTSQICSGCLRRYLNRGIEVSTV